MNAVVLASLICFQVSEPFADRDEKYMTNLDLHLCGFSMVVKCRKEDEGRFESPRNLEAHPGQDYGVENHTQCVVLPHDETHALGRGTPFLVVALLKCRGVKGGWLGVAILIQLDTGARYVDFEHAPSALLPTSRRTILRLFHDEELGSQGHQRDITALAIVNLDCSCA